jgi:hypothetical protein
VNIILDRAAKPVRVVVVITRLVLCESLDADNVWQDLITRGIAALFAGATTVDVSTLVRPPLLSL